MHLVSTRMMGRVAALVFAGLCAGCVSATPGTTCQPEASSFAFGMNSKWLMVVGPAGCSDTLDLTGNINVRLDSCYMANPSPALYDVTPGTSRELDR